MGIPKRVPRRPRASLRGTRHPAKAAGASKVVVLLATATKEAGPPLEVAMHLPCRHAGVGGEAIGARAIPKLGVAIKGRAGLRRHATVEGVEEADVRRTTSGATGVPVAAKDAYLGAEVTRTAPTGLGGRLACRT